MLRAETLSRREYLAAKGYCQAKKYIFMRHSVAINSASLHVFLSPLCILTSEHCVHMGVGFILSGSQNRKQITNTYRLWCWRRLLRLPWTARRCNQPILKKINPEYSLEGLILKLKLQYFGHLLWRANSLEKTPMLGKTEGKRRKWQRIKWLDSITDSVDVNLSKLWEIVKDRGVWHTAVCEVTVLDKF